MQANYKIQGAKLQYDIYALCLRLRDNTFRAEHEEKVSPLINNCQAQVQIQVHSRSILSHSNLSLCHHPTNFSGADPDPKPIQSDF